MLYRTCPPGHIMQTLWGRWATAHSKAGNMSREINGIVSTICTSTAVVEYCVCFQNSTCYLCLVWVTECTTVLQRFSPGIEETFSEQHRHESHRIELLRRRAQILSSSSERFEASHVELSIKIANNIEFSFMESSSFKAKSTVRSFRTGGMTLKRRIKRSRSS